MWGARVGDVRTVGALRSRECIEQVGVLGRWRCHGRLAERRALCLLLKESMAASDVQRQGRHTGQLAGAKLGEDADWSRRAPASAMDDIHAKVPPRCLGRRGVGSVGEQRRRRHGRRGRHLDGVRCSGSVGCIRCEWVGSQLLCMSTATPVPSKGPRMSALAEWHNFRVRTLDCNLCRHPVSYKPCRLITKILTLNVSAEKPAKVQCTRAAHVVHDAAMGGG